MSTVAQEVGRGGLDESGPQTESSIEPRFRLRGSIDNEWGRSESIDPGDVDRIIASARKARRPTGQPAATELARDRAHVNRLTNSSAFSATSRQPASIVSACPRPGILTISVTPSLRFCFL